MLLNALRPAMRGRTALCDSSYRGGITADGYVPGAGGDGRLSARHDRHQGGGQLQRNDGAEGSPVSLGSTLANLGLQFAGIATVLYMSARMTQYMLQLKERETQQAARSLLRAKLPARSDIDMDSLNLNAHEISVVMVSRCPSGVRRTVYMWVLPLGLSLQICVFWSQTFTLESYPTCSPRYQVSYSRSLTEYEDLPPRLFAERQTCVRVR